MPLTAYDAAPDTIAAKTSQAPRLLLPLIGDDLIVEKGFSSPIDARGTVRWSTEESRHRRGAFNRRHLASGRREGRAREPSERAREGGKETAKERNTARNESVLGRPPPPPPPPQTLVSAAASA